MKKAFEQNVSRTRPRVRLGNLVEEPPGPGAEEAPAPAAAPARPASPGRPPSARAAAARSDPPRTTAPPQAEPARRGSPEAVTELLARHAVEPAAGGPVPREQPARPAPSGRGEEDPAARRERLRQRLKAAREQPRPEPLPATAAAAGMLAVERIATLQAELVELKAHNQVLTQELEASRRQSERATEEARVRVEEARRLAAEVEGRTKLLADLEKELAALEGERDETLLGIQALRARELSGTEERQRLEAALADRDRQISEGLQEEERLATELESLREEMEALRRTVSTLAGEREMLARQVAELTAERQELLDARKALEAVHRALTEAARR